MAVLLMRVGSPRPGAVLVMLDAIAPCRTVNMRSQSPLKVVAAQTSSGV